MLPRSCRPPTSVLTVTQVTRGTINAARKGDFAFIMPQVDLPQRTGGFSTGPVQVRSARTRPIITAPDESGFPHRGVVGTSGTLVNHSNKNPRRDGGGLFTSNFAKAKPTPPSTWIKKWN